MRRVSPWRVAAGEVIERLLEEGRAQGKEGRTLARHVSKGYPFGPRKRHPYKVWLHEFEWRVLGRVRPFSTKARQRYARRFDARQLGLFDVALRGPGADHGP